MSILGLKDKQISEIKDPFAFENVTKFRCWCYKSLYGNWVYHGAVEFENGKTKGQQDFEAESFAGLIRKMEAFMKELERL